MYKQDCNDLESGSPATLYPGISVEENALRWAFVRKVYGILSSQLLLTVIVAAVVVFCKPFALFFVHNPFVFMLVAILSLIMICPLHYYHQKHPLNLLLLGIFTATFSLTIGVVCAFTSGKIILEALILTAVVVLSLTAYTYWAARKGYDFSFLGPILFTCLIILFVFSLIQAFFPLGRLSVTIYGGLAAILFSAYIVYDTDNLIKRYNYDEYIWASVVLYLDILNLFLALVDLLRGLQQ